MWLKRILSSEKGEIPDADYRDSTPGLDESTVDASSETQVEDTPQPNKDEQGYETLDVTPQPDDQQAAPGQPEAFDETSLNLDPNTFTPENRAIFKKMQAAFTQKMQQFAPLQEKASIVDRFYNDKQYAYDTLRQWASQNGLQVLPMGQDPATGKPQGENKVQAPAEIVNTLKQNLPPGTEWLAESLAPGLWSVLSGMLQPIAAQSQEQRKQVRMQEYDKYETELAQRYPTWFEHEDRMTNLLDFLEDKDALYSKEWGSKLSLVHDITTRVAQELSKKQARTTTAKQHAQPKPRQAGPVNSDPELQILKAKTSSDAFDLAAKHAKSILKR